MWMILKQVEFQKYEIMLSSEIEAKIPKFSWTSAWLPPAQKLYSKGIVLQKREINMAYHLTPLPEEDALTEIFLES